MQACYISLTVLNLLLLYLAISRKVETPCSFASSFQWVLSAFFVLRLTWLSSLQNGDWLEDTDVDVHLTEAADRLSWALFFTAFTIVLSSWLEVLRSFYHLRRATIHSYNMVFIAGNLLSFLGCGISLALCESRFSGRHSSMLCLNLCVPLPLGRLL